MIQERLESELRAVKELNARLTRDLKVGCDFGLTPRLSSVVALAINEKEMMIHYMRLFYLSQKYCRVRR